ncbi:hypothetical protein JIN85_15890 [Luteolibacter pohnpeiensis]|uniref:Beta-ketoacyl synthase-like N-terminal domain-containing protein n=1 Tax=Luteolibacter pohnpeiensis TaxID=454153 RepID=A0A934S6B4_9BACT|nr:beta-ketoacyl synthase N-terminal-like domain-containing protein [Luteolibacter pohnpeiensis]MBK1883900.1 hypothetical protein [Luteolibacter pohnpeiensis]
MKSSIAITGTGAVSPAGWGSPSLLAAMQAGLSLSKSEMVRELDGRKITTPVLRVPADASAAPKFPRLRRTSPISKFAAAAAMEALGQDRRTRSQNGELRIGVIFTLTNGCVNYSNRFFGEVLNDPAVASPILFPETVFNAPSSHLSAMIGSNAPNDTLVGDSTGFFTGIDLAVEWILRGDVDGCLVVAAEEIDWLSAEGLSLYSRNYLPSEGAAAIYLEPGQTDVLLHHLPDPVSLSNQDRAAASLEIRRHLGKLPSDTLLVDGTTGVNRFDRAEQSAWSDWQGLRWSPRQILGEAMGASSALQVVAAIEAIKAGISDHAAIVSTGANQQAAGMRIGR